MQITEHKDAINCIDIMEGIALDFKAPLLDLVLANDSTFLSSLPLSACPKWCFIPFYVPVTFGTSCFHILLLQILLSSWRSCIHLFSLPQAQSHNYNRKKARLYIQNARAATHPKNSSCTSSMTNSLCDSTDQEDCELQDWRLNEEKTTNVTYPCGFTEGITSKQCVFLLPSF